MYQTKLMKLANRHSGQNLYANTAIIDTTVYMLCEMAESNFGGDIIESLEEYILYTQTGLPKLNVLEKICSLFIEQLTRDLHQLGHESFAKDLAELGEFKTSRHTDFMVAAMKLETMFRTGTMEVALKDIQKLFAGVTTETPYTVCAVVADYFKVTKNDYGLFLVIKKLCQYINQEAERD